MKVKFSATTHDRINSVPVENGQVIAVLDQPGYYYDFSGTRYSITPPAAVSQLTNDSGFINIQAVDSLPTTDISTTTIYLVPAADPGQQNVRDEYINTTGTSEGWEQIGSTSVDLSDYVTQSDLSSTLEGYVEDYELSDYVTYSSMSETLESYAEDYELQELRDDLGNYLLKYNSNQYSDSIQIDTSSSMRLNSDDAIDINASTTTISAGYDTSVAVSSDGVNIQTNVGMNVNASTVTFGGGYQSVDTLSINASTFSAGSDEYNGINLTGSQFGVSVNSNSMTMGSSGTTISGNGKVVIDEGSCSGPSITVGQKTIPGSGTLDGVIVESNRSIYLIGDSINLVANDDEIYIKGSSSSRKNLFDLITMFEAMCPIETTATTSRSYQKGDIFYDSNYASIYQATADIAAGTTIYSAPTQAIGNLGEAMRYIVSMSNT